MNWSAVTVVCAGALAGALAAEAEFSAAVGRAALAGPFPTGPPSRRRFATPLLSLVTVVPEEEVAVVEAVETAEEAAEGMVLGVMLSPLLGGSGMMGKAGVTTGFFRMGLFAPGGRGGAVAAMLSSLSDSGRWPTWSEWCIEVLSDAEDARVVEG